MARIQNKDFPVFFDLRGKRRTRMRNISFVLFGVFLISLIGFLVSIVLVNPALPRINIRAQAAEMENKSSQKPDWLKKNETQKTKETIARNDEKDDQKTFPVSLDSNHTANAQNPISIGFYVNWDDTSYSSLKRNVKQLDCLVPEWIRLQDAAGNREIRRGGA